MRVLPYFFSFSFSCTLYANRLKIFFLYSMCKLGDAFQWHFPFHLVLKRLENIFSVFFYICLVPLVVVAMMTTTVVATVIEWHDTLERERTIFVSQLPLLSCSTHAVHNLRVPYTFFLVLGAFIFFFSCSFSRSLFFFYYQQGKQYYWCFACENK